MREWTLRVSSAERGSIHLPLRLSDDCRLGVSHRLTGVDHNTWFAPYAGPGDGVAIAAFACTSSVKRGGGDYNSSFHLHSSS